MDSNETDNESPSSCCPGGTCGIPRRNFLTVLAAGAATAAIPVMAGPFDASEQAKLIPADKKLDAKWVKSLYARGTREVYRGKELEKIGMPVGGLCAGQLYLGGDGELWHWDIFNKRIGTDQGHYANPPAATSPLEQGFAVEVEIGSEQQARALDRNAFPEVTFCGEYPLAFVEYRDPKFPVTVSLDAFSPHVPLDTLASSLPATVMRFTVKNTGSAKATVKLFGRLENAVALYTAPGNATPRLNTVRRKPGLLMVYSELMKPTAPRRREPADHDHGTLALALLDAAETDYATPAIGEGKAAFPENPPQSAHQPPNRKLVGAVGKKMTLEAGQEATATFVIAWHFPHLKLKDNGHFYATRFADAAAVADYVAANFKSLREQTHLWHDTWYDSTLPYWFLDRTYLNTSILATSTAHRFATGRFWGWEGVGCCEGTCTHVWHYGHAMARLFPDLERNLRQKTDFAFAQDPRTGIINHRGDQAGMAVDGQAGCILRAYREHQMTADNEFIKSIWPRVKLAMDALIHKDDGRGMLEGPQHNTLDAEWFGRVAWLSSLYLAALRACEEMATELGDRDYAAKVRDIFERGSKSLDRELFNGEYYYQISDKEHAKRVGSQNGCEIDQVFGQSWAYQVGLGRILPEDHVKQALRSLWKYNFAPDVGPFRKAHPPGRWYAMAGEAGLIMCSWPKGEALRVSTGFDFYFNECMNGFEYQAAGHMIWEGLVEEGLAVTRALHDRYHPARRNPWNEVECGDHYARSMASYGVFLAACGYEYHGPKGHLGFAPRLTPDNFRAAFTTAEGWGTFAQKDEAGARKARVAVKWGKLALKTLAVLPAADSKPTTTIVTLGGNPVAAQLALADGRVVITFANELTILPGDELVVQFS